MDATELENRAKLALQYAQDADVKLEALRAEVRSLREANANPHRDVDATEAVIGALNQEFDRGWKEGRASLEAECNRLQAEILRVEKIHEDYIVSLQFAVDADPYKAPEQLIERARMWRNLALGPQAETPPSPPAPTSPPDERLLALARALIDLNPANIATIGALSELSGDPGIVVATQQRLDLNERVFLVQREDDRVSRGWAFLRELVAEADARAKVADDDIPF